MGSTRVLKNSKSRGCAETEAACFEADCAPANGAGIYNASAATAKLPAIPAKQTLTITSPPNQRFVSLHVSDIKGKNAVIPSTAKCEMPSTLGRHQRRNPVGYLSDWDASHLFQSPDINGRDRPECAVGNVDSLAIGGKSDPLRSRPHNGISRQL